MEAELSFLLHRCLCSVQSPAASLWGVGSHQRKRMNEETGMKVLYGRKALLRITC
jgi:hypothetical protein